MPWTNQILPNDQAQPSDWEIGPHRFPLSAQNRYYNFDGFAYPAAFTPGTLGRNTFESPGLRWTQLSLSKEFCFTERMIFTIRWHCNNPTKEPQFPDPNGVFNLANRANFGTFPGMAAAVSQTSGPRGCTISWLDGSSGSQMRSASPWSRRR